MRSAVVAFGVFGLILSVPACAQTSRPPQMLDVLPPPDLKPSATRTEPTAPRPSGSSNSLTVVNGEGGIEPRPIRPAVSGPDALNEMTTRSRNVVGNEIRIENGKLTHTLKYADGSSGSFSPGANGTDFQFSPAPISR